MPHQVVDVPRGRRRAPCQVLGRHDHVETLPDIHQVPLCWRRSAASRNAPGLLPRSRTASSRENTARPDDSRPSGRHARSGWRRLPLGTREWSTVGRRRAGENGLICPQWRLASQRSRSHQGPRVRKRGSGRDPARERTAWGSRSSRRVPTPRKIFSPRWRAMISRGSGPRGRRVRPLVR